MLQLQSIWEKLNNICCLTDSYKVSHYLQYPPGTQYVYSYFEPRSKAKFSEFVFFGLQYYISEYLRGPVVTAEKIRYAKKLYKDHFGKEVFNESGWRYILDKYNGHLPVRIKAVAEGTVIPISNVAMTIENTDPRCYWLTNYLETLLVQLWYGSTVATQSREMKKIILKYLHKTGTPELIDFKLHDFGFRGVSSVETAAMGGAAHLLNFKGTDTTPAIILAKEIYGCKMAGFSIPAAEHSTITSWGIDRESDAYENMLDKYPDGMVAVVSDSYDIYNACRCVWGSKKLKEKIMMRKGVLIIRPDSGDPPTVVCEILQILWDVFGGKVNKKGYRVLDDHVRIIQGDGIDFEMLDAILFAMEKKGFSTDNIAFGSGGGLLQKLNRDTEDVAIKCCAITIDGVEKPVFKKPQTDLKKGSKQGRLELVRWEGTYRTTENNKLNGVAIDAPGHLRDIFLDGRFRKRHKFDECRERCAVA